MLKLSDYPRSAFRGYFEIVHADDKELAMGLNVSVGTVIARVYPTGLPVLEHKGFDLKAAEDWVKKEMAELRKETA